MKIPHSNLTLAQEQWLLGQIKPCPEVFILAYAGTNFKEWKMVHMCSQEEYKKITNIEKFVHEYFPSATIARVFFSCQTTTAQSHLEPDPRGTAYPMPSNPIVTC